ncbi:MAG TPA: UvrD-helicase domain-containing protein [Thermoanaerobaculia bacterium]|nr:UvrD-helicase domain-containing protein [Thermoanaerobaculia bacterium]
MSVARYAHPEVLSRIPATGHVVIEASAGTGKTYTLEHLVVHLLLAHGVPMERILVVTFTEKATEELRDRVRRKLWQLAHEEAAASPAGGEEECWVLDDDARSLLRDAVVAFDAATISTIHGFCQRILTEQAFAHRRLFRQQLVDGREAFGRAFREALREGLATADPLAEGLRCYRLQGRSFDGLEALTWEAVRERGELTPRWDPGALLGAAEGLLGATPSAAEVLAAAVRALGGRPAAPCKALAQLCDRAAVLVEGGDPLAFGEAFVAWASKSRSVASTSGPFLRRLRQVLLAPGSRQPAAERLVATLDRLAELATPLEPYVVGELARRTARRLEERKRSLGLYDFDDMLRLVHDALAGPGGEALAAGLRQRWRVALIDEFQDTDELQWGIFRRLFFTGGGQRLFLVGDPKQAIYGFRNADVHTYLAARDQVRASGGAVLALERSFRAGPALLAAGNRIFAGGFFSGELAYREVTSGRPAMAAIGRDGGELAPVSLLHLAGAERRLRRADLFAGLGDFIAREVRRLVDGGGLRLRDGDSVRRIGLRDVFLLTFNRDEGRLLGEALRQAGVPHAFYREEGLFQTAEAEHLLAVLRAVAAPRDRAARLRAWLSPFFDVPLAALPGLRELTDTHPLCEQLERWHALAVARDYGSLLRSLARDSGLTRRLLFAVDGERELTNYLHLLEVLLQEGHAAPRHVSELADWLAAVIAQRRSPGGADGNVQRLEGDREAVQILTMHKAKGLEAAVVFLAGGFTRGGSKLAVYHQGHERRAHLGNPVGAIAEAVESERRQEDERLLYVAATRARLRLYLPCFAAPPAADAAPGGHWGYDCTGPYGVMAQRLQALLAAGEAAAPLFDSRTVPCPPTQAAGGQPAAEWRPGPRLLASTNRAAEVRAELGRLRATRRGPLVTSYTRLRRLHPNELVAGEREAEPEPAPLATPEEALPGGREIGIFLHAALEEAAYDQVLAAADLAAWRTQPEVVSTFARLAARHAVPQTAVPPAQELVFSALRTPLRLPGLELPRGLCAVTTRQAEMELLYPIPEGWHPQLGEPGAGDGPTFRVGRGFVQGVVDLVFEAAGRVWVLDWKSDRLAAWDAGFLAAHVAEHYDLQARLYALGIARLLALRAASDHQTRFGGILYCFLRGMPQGGGIWFHRPAWEELQQWEADLRQREAWW